MKKIFLLLLILPASLFATSSSATVPIATYSFNQGVDYKVLPSTTLASPIKKNQVAEFFSYGCPWCYKMEPVMKKIKLALPPAANFIQIPVVFERGWDIYAKAYYTANALGIVDQINPKLFAAVQKENKSLDTTEAMTQFFIQNGVDKKVAQSALSNSLSIIAQVKQGNERMQAYKVFSVPSLVIGGRYKTDLAMVKGDKEKLVALTQYLLQKTMSEK